MQIGCSNFLQHIEGRSSGLVPPRCAEESAVSAMQVLNRGGKRFSYVTRSSGRIPAAADA
jgi:hypothetical protein